MAQRKVRDFIRKKLVHVTPETKLRDCAKIMYKENVSSVVVLKNNKPLGIVTDSDLRRLIAENFNFGESVGSFIRMKKGLVAVDADDDVHEALSRMLEHGIKHTVVLDNGLPSGVITIGDIAYSFSPFYIYYTIKLRRAKSKEEVREILESFKAGIKDFSMELFDKPDTSPKFIFTTISYVTDTAVRVLADLLGVPENIVYAVTGSWGRREQYLLTDRDTISIYRLDGEGVDELIDEMVYREFIEDLEDCMDEVGFPPCPHGYTSRNYSYSFEDMQKVILKCCKNPEENAVFISILADARALIGDEELLVSLKRLMFENLRKNRFLVANSLMYKPAITLFGQAAKEFDIKARGIAPVEYPVRALAVVNGIYEVNTELRIRSLADNGIIPRDLAHELIMAYNILLAQKIKVQNEGRNEVLLSSLPEIERKMVENAMKIVRRFQVYVERNYV
ncbi:putative signal-transduction protein containing cAMP-binding and CBS domains [Archaeoglobus sulfaticallidus PM70-1]|uniref:Putative signal-transduction protein containing cAMP-binding and CBS domains n=1 Tax=Archaeoglobus sulfaticallidus PM70-1 TaxID=387631 RepID=N0BEE8_9EURY|nr:CBS domain-containing protein [Archaeoglobus sulfaticallidus]AGK60627.1 putative signal-transduction protein containing cAMP-binding and CBS domains [Archaeoglobus sulfaticallidus PM70-1]